MQQVQLALENLPLLDHENIESAMRLLANKLDLKLGKLLNPVRLAITGQRVSPPLFETLEILGSDLILGRIEKAIKLLKDI